MALPKCLFFVALFIDNKNKKNLTADTSDDGALDFPKSEKFLLLDKHYNLYETNVLKCLYL